jgi:hypothetical protein
VPILLVKYTLNLAPFIWGSSRMSLPLASPVGFELGLYILYTLASLLVSSGVLLKAWFWFSIACLIEYSLLLAVVSLDSFTFIVLDS